MARKFEQDPKLVALALERKIPIHEGMTNKEIADLLGPTPPSQEQQAYANMLVGRPVP